MNYKNLLISSAVIFILLITSYIAFIGFDLNRSLQPSWHSSIENQSEELAKVLQIESIYRLEKNVAKFRLWIFPSFNHKTLIELILSNKNSILKVSYFDYDQDGESYKVLNSYSRSLQPVEREAFISELIYSQFLHIKTDKEKKLGLDGTNWAIELNINNTYLFRDGWEVDDRPFVILRNSLISLSNISRQCLEINCDDLRDRITHQTE
ncbi:MAG: hypothetical protein OQJ89_10070 [Kangiellaceae bacterium]|nr:hypothetical protein [Kangiellaceae bacterium]MCW8997518.1 hypothetical protein [Kangiellaceae bacterium]MCW9017300.1 hypothetical protein [Kangiellaceae bacterium]